MRILNRQQSEAILSAKRAIAHAEERFQFALACAGAEQGDAISVGPDGLVRFTPAVPPACEAPAAKLPEPVPMPAAQPKSNGASHGEAEAQV